MNCKECIHYDVCDYLPCETINLLDDMERRCEYIKDKSKFREIVHGEWIWELADNGWTDHICSICGWRKNTDIHVRLGYNFCPNCGSDMRGDVDD